MNPSSCFLCKYSFCICQCSPSPDFFHPSLKQRERGYYLVYRMPRVSYQMRVNLKWTVSQRDTIAIVPMLPSRGIELKIEGSGYESHEQCLDSVESCHRNFQPLGVSHVVIFILTSIIVNVI